MGAPLDYDEAVKEWDADGRAGLWWTNQVDQQKKTGEIKHQVYLIESWMLTFTEYIWSSEP